MKRTLVISVALLLSVCLSGQDYPELKSLSEKKLEQISQGGLTPFQKKNLWGYQDASGKVIVKPVFDMTYPFDQFGCSKVMFHDKFGLVSSVCEYVVPPCYDSISDFDKNRSAIVSLDGLNGVINTEGLILLKVEYDVLERFAGSNFLVRKNGKYGMLDSKYKFVIPAEYDSISVCETGGYNVVKNELAGLVDYDGKIIVPALYDQVRSSADKKFYFVAKDGLFGTVDKSGNVMTSPRYDKVDYTLTGKVYLTYAGSHTGFLGMDGKEVLPAVYESVRLAGPSNFVSCRAGKYALHSLEGNELTASEYDSINEPFNVRFFPVRKKGKSGIITLDGKEYIPCRYDTVEWNSRGYWVVSNNGLFGAVSDKGSHEELIECGLGSAPELTGTSKLYFVNGRYYFASINSSISLRDADKKLYDSNQKEISRYINSEEIPASAKLYLDAASSQMIKEKEDKVLADQGNIENYLDRGLWLPAEFDSSSKTIEETVGTNIYTHTIYSAYQNGASAGDWVSWINDSKNSTFALYTKGHKILASVIAAKITKGKYSKVKSMFNFYSESQVELEPLYYIDNFDGSTFTLIFDVHFLNDAKMLPSQIGVPSEIASLFSDYGFYYNVAVQFDKNLNIKSFCYLPYYDDGVFICSSHGGFYCVDDGLLSSLATKISPMLRYSADCRYLQSFGNTGESILAFCEDSKYVYLCGSTSKEGYIDFENPLFYTLDKSTKRIVKYTFARKAEVEDVLPSTSGVFALMSDTGDYEVVDYSLLGAYVRPANDKLVLKTEWSDFGGYHIGGCGLAYESTGEWKVRPVYEVPADGECVTFEDWSIYPFSEGLALVAYKGKFGYADESGKMVIPFRYDTATSFADGRATVAVGSTTYDIDKSGKKIQ